MQSKRDDFNGWLTPSTRRSLREKRLSLGLSLKEAGSLLDTDWSTVRNWENGRTSHCHPSHAARLRCFLAGEYDTAMPLHASSRAETHREVLDMPLGMQFCAERLADACRLCADDEALRTRLVAAVGRSIAGCLRSLVE